MKNQKIAVLEKLYADFAKSDFESVLGHCAEGITFQVAGKSKLAGKYTRANFVKEFAGKLMEFSGGTFALEIHDILASDQHAAVLTSEKVSRGGKVSEYRTVHIWRFEGDKPLAWYSYPRDLYAFDLVWG